MLISNKGSADRQDIKTGILNAKPLARVSYAHTGRLPKLVLGLLDRTLPTDWMGQPCSTEGVAKKAEERAQMPCNRLVLVDVLKRQYAEAGIELGPKVLSQIEALRSETTFTVTTGHQLNIFTGPLYFIHKIAHTIKLAREAEAALPGHRVVPMFWMNTEDHDLPEIASAHVHGQGFKWETDQSGPTGRMITAGLPELAAQIAALCAQRGRGEEPAHLFAEAYDGKRTLAQATRIVAHRLFGQHGLVIIDGDDADLKRLFIPAMRQDLVEHTSFKNVGEVSKQLDTLGYHVQVNPREVNLFWMENGLRNRIVRTENGFHVLGTDLRFTPDEMMAVLSHQPEKFSPNVVLRPLYQEVLLPNLAYVGGAGELSYWLEYASNFAHQEVSFPILALRSHWLLVHQAQADRMAALGLMPEDLFKSTHELVNDKVVGTFGEEVSVNDELRLLHALYDNLQQKAMAADPSLKAAVEADRARQTAALQNWQSRLAKAVKLREEASVNKIKKLHEQLFPNGALQERHDNVLSHYTPTLIRDLIELSEVWDPTFGVIQI